MSSECRQGGILENEPRPSTADVLEALRVLHISNRKPVPFNTLFSHLKEVLPVSEWRSEDNAVETPETLLTNVRICT